MPNENPVRRKASGVDWREQKTRDGKTIKLVRFYERLGLSRGKNPNRMILTREDFTAASTGRKAGSTGQHPKNSLTASRC
jgi:hypothetical protein